MKSTHERSIKNKLSHGFWILSNAVLVVACGLMAFLVPVINSLEDEESAALSLTTSGRLDLAWYGFLGVLVVSLFPAGISYLSSKAFEIKDEKPVRIGKGLKMALFVWGTVVACGLVGAVGFCLQMYPF